MLIPFYIVEHELAAAETRTITIFAPYDGVPPGSYGLFEYYCPDPACDCRRVMLNVVEKQNPDLLLAAISYAFDRDDEMAGPLLDPMNPQCEYAENLLRLVDEMTLREPDYIARLERHYAIVKQAASDPTHPAYRRLQKTVADDANPIPIPVLRPARKSRKKRPKRKSRPRRKR